MIDWLITSSWDERIGAGILVFLAAVSALYAGRLARSGRARSVRVDQQGGSVLLNQFSKEFGHWVLQPGANFLTRLGFTANQVSWTSLVLGAAAAFAIIADHFGLAALFSLLAMAFDVFDGMIARLMGTSSDAGEVLDASLDRYVEFFFMGALVIYYRASLFMMTASLAACLGSFMVSYSTAKAEAMHVTAPKSSMRRPERAMLLVLGATLSSLTRRFENPESMILYPMAVAILWLAVGSNVAAPIRLYRIAQSLRRHEPGKI